VVTSVVYETRLQVVGSGGDDGGDEEPMRRAA
jgi:hypothetical protein